MKPPCDYNLEGIDEVRVLDFEDFKGYKFEGDNLYANCRVIAILRTGDLAEIATAESTKYGSTISANIYSHVLETFVPNLTAGILANAHLGTKRRYVVVFRSKMGRYYTFGYEAGAVFTYTAQTPESLGALVTLTAASVYPLFETDAAALELNNSYTGEFIPDLDDNTYCKTD